MKYQSQEKLSAMKYYRFSRRRKKSCVLYYNFSLYEKYIRSKQLESDYYENEVLGALCKAWKGYVIAKNKGEDDKMELYARRIQALQHGLGLSITSFDNIGVTNTSFLWDLVQKDNDNQEQ